MSKSRSKYVCQQCGYSQVGWAGKCPSCDSWGSLVEQIDEIATTKRGNKIAASSKIVGLTQVPVRKTVRTFTKITELDRVLGGGLVPGQVILIAGEPGIGKSTLLLELANNLGRTLYVSGEESKEQVKIRADRLRVKNKQLLFIEDTNVDSVIAAFENEHEKNAFDLLIVDSVQTMYTDDLSGLSGSVGQVRECTSRLLKSAKNRNVPLFIVGHVTKEGTVAGPAVLAHIVDTVLWFEGEKSLSLRLLRAVKNRFGPTDEVGIFAMEEKGLVSQADAEKLFLTKRGKKGIPGSVVSSVMNGTRSMLVEIQSLVVPTKMAFPKRTTQGIDARRLEMLLAILIRRCGLPLYDFDVFVNVAGGLNVKEPSADLAICLSIASAYFDKAVDANGIAIGEVGLLGEIREVNAEEKRVKEAKRLGFGVSYTQSKYPYISQAIKDIFR